MINSLNSLFKFKYIIQFDKMKLQKSVVEQKDEDRSKVSVVKDEIDPDQFEHTSLPFYIKVILQLFRVLLKVI